MNLTVSTRNVHVFVFFWGFCGFFGGRADWDIAKFHDLYFGSVHTEAHQWGQLVQTDYGGILFLKYKILFI